MIPRERTLRLNSLLPPYLAPPQNLQSVARGSITFAIDSTRQQQTFSRRCCWERVFSSRGFTFRFTTSFDLLPSLGEPRLSYPIPLPCLKDRGDTGTQRHGRELYVASLVQQDATEEVPHLHKAPVMTHLHLLRLQIVTLTSLWTATQRTVPFVSHMLSSVGLAVSAPAVEK